MTESWKNDLRLIESGFPCHQVGAETQRERGASSALPPLYFLHVWWARRPLTPSRAAILASLLPADTDPEWFLRELGIEKKVVEINGRQWVISDKLSNNIKHIEGRDVIVVDEKIIRAIKAENKIRNELLEFLQKCLSMESLAIYRDSIEKWKTEALSIVEPSMGDTLEIKKMPADPAWANEKKEIGKLSKLWFPGDPYGYKRAFQNTGIKKQSKDIVVLDPTSGGGSIPFEALRLGYNVIANELNPVATVILHATLEYPMKYGLKLRDDIKKWGIKLFEQLEDTVVSFFIDKQSLPDTELNILKVYLSKYPQYINEFNQENIIDYLYCRQVTCPNCQGDAPLLNTCWLSKESGKQWGVRIIPDGRQKNGSVRFETYRVSKCKGPDGADPNFATVKNAVGHCIHCKQAIDSKEIKSQARGESSHGTWKDRLYCVVAVRFQPKLDKNGTPLRYKSGKKRGEIKTQKIRFFRSPNKQDLNAIKEAEKCLKENWDPWDREGLIPVEKIPLAHKTKEPLRVGMNRWCDMFTPRQLLGHVTLIQELNRLKPKIIEELGEDKGRAVVTYLQFAIDKGVDYNSRQTRWIAQRGQVSGTFGRHDFSLKWTFGEMVFSGPNSGFAWSLSQIYDAYKGMAELISSTKRSSLSATIRCGTAAYMPEIENNCVDLICMDPPYYNNVQYAELSDFFYVWQKRTLHDLYPEYFKRRLTDKNNEAVANPDRDGGKKAAHNTYEKIMTDIFKECRRVLNPKGILTMMFTHKSQNAWEVLTKSLIENSWIISSAIPVESEFANSQHIMNKASAASSIFIACRKRLSKSQEPDYWTGFGGTGVQQRIQDAVSQGLKELEPLKLNPVDEMVASYGRALRILSEQWPVIDGDKEVGPIRAMNEASRVVSEYQIKRITKGRLKVEDLSPEAAMALTLFGIYGLGEFSYDEALNLSRSLNIALESKTGGYTPEGRFIGYNTQAGARSRSKRSSAEDNGFQAPLVRKGSKLRLALPEERHQKRFEFPQTEWDILQGLIMAYREGDIPVARGYLNRHAEDKSELIMDLVNVWATEISDQRLKKEAQAIVFGLK